MPVDDSLQQESSDEEVNDDAVSDDTADAMDLSVVIPREDEESESTRDQDSLRQEYRKIKVHSLHQSSTNKQEKHLHAEKSREVSNKVNLK